LFIERLGRRPESHQGLSKFYGANASVYLAKFKNPSHESPKWFVIKIMANSDLDSQEILERLEGLVLKIASCSFHDCPLEKIGSMTVVIDWHASEVQSTTLFIIMEFLPLFGGSFLRFHAHGFTYLLVSIFLSPIGCSRASPPDF
jgi:hypothetical protein